MARTEFEANNSVQVNVKVDENLERPKSSFKIFSISQSCWFADVKVNNTSIDMLVDTGADVTLISSKLYFDLGFKKSVLKPVSRKLTTADGDPMEILGMIIIPMLFSEQIIVHPVIVANLGELDGILGIDFLSQNKVSIDTANGVLRSPYFEEVILHKDNAGTETCARVHLTETVHIPPHSEMFVKGEIQGHYPGSLEGCIEPLDEFRGSDKLLMPKSVVKTAKSDVIFSVLNPTPDRKILKKNVQVASIVPVDSITIYKAKDSDNDNPTSRKSIPDHLRVLVENVSPKLSQEQRCLLTDLVVEYADIFVGPDGKLGHTDFVEHEIDVGEAKPIKLPLRRLPIAQREVAEKEMEKMIDQGIIQRSNSPWAAPIVLARKRDGTWRFCVDYRRLNSVTRKDAYPLPRIDESLDSLAGAKYFCTADMASSFWQVSVKEDDRPKTAFITHKGLFEFRHMPFGMANSPKTFERLMDIVLSGLHWEKVLVYLDDVIVFGKTFMETLQNLKLVFGRLREANLKLKPKKCTFFQDEIKYLGHLVSEKGVRCDTEKTEAIRNWPRPKNVPDIRSFLGLASYYRKFIPSFSEISFPLNQLTRKNQKFIWSDKCENSFHKLREALTSTPVLAYPTRDDPFILDTDASLYGVGAVLSQVQEGEERVICYGSKTLTRSQSKYCTTYRELLAVVTFVKQFKHYLYGRKFLIRTDHSSLIWLKNFKEPEGMIARWISLLETYDFEIKHRRGTAHGNADALSRVPHRPCKRSDCPQCKSSEMKPVNTKVDSILENTGENENFLPSHIFEKSNDIIAPVVSNWLDQWTPDDLHQMQEEDATIRSVVKFLKEGSEKPSVQSPDQELITLLKQWDQLIVENGLLYRRFFDVDGSIRVQLVVPKPIRFEIMQNLHNNRISGHLGREKTLNKVRARFYWPGMTTDINRWCQTCGPCARTKAGPGKGKSPMNHCTVYGPLDCIAIDIMGPLPETDDGNQYIMVIGDYFTKWKEAYAIPNHTAMTVADKLVTEFICRFGTPNRIHTDQGREFESELFSEICKLLQVNKSRTTPYHPQSDGMVERYNQTVQTMLAMYVNENRSDWDDHLPYVMMAYRAATHESTKFTPNKLMFGREVSLPIDVIAGDPNVPKQTVCPIEYVEWVKNALQNAYQIAHENIETSFQTHKRYYDVKLKARAFNEGQLVWYWYPPTAKQKLGLGWTGPFEINKKISDITYQIKSKETGKLKIVHVNNLKPLEGDGFQNEMCTTMRTTVSNANSGDETSINHTVPEPIETIVSENHTTTTPTYTRSGRQVKPKMFYSP